MESTWYLFPGQTEENTRIRDRAKALIAPAEEWDKITARLDRKKMQEEQRKLEESKRQHLKDASHEMTKNWDNSIEKIRHRRLEELTRKAQAREDKLVERFLQLKKEQEQERNEIVEKARRKMYMDKDKPRSLNSALLLSEVLYERELQLKFEQQEQEHERIEEAKYAQCVKQNAEWEKIENEEKRKRKKELDVKHSIELKEQIKEIQEEERKERETKLVQERNNNIMAKEEMQEIKQYEEKLDRDKKADVKKQFNEFHEIQKRYKEEKQKQDEVENRIINIYNKARCRINNKIKAKTQEFQDEKILVREKIVAKLQTRSTDREEKEEKILANAKAVLERREKKMLAKKEKYQQKLVEGLKNSRKEYLEQKEKDVAEQKELQKWEFLNRLKTSEITEQYERDKKQKNFDEKIKYRKELFKQMDDIKQEMLHEKQCEAEELQEYKTKLAKDDKEFFDYSEEVLDLAKSRSRPLDPILNVVQKYKIDNDLEPKNKNITHLKSNVPINNNK